MNIRKRLEQLERNSNGRAPHTFAIIWAEEPDTYYVAGKPMTKADFHRAYPGPHTLIRLVWER